MSENLIDGRPENEVWEDYRKNQTETLRNAIVKQYAPLVKYVAGKISVGMPHHVDFEDLVGFGIFGLFDAIERFDPSKHVKFKTYAVTRVKGAIFDELRSIDWIPRSIRQKTKEFDEAIRKLEGENGRSATDEEIAKELKITMEEYNKNILKISSTSLLSLNDVWNVGDDNDAVSLVESVEAPISLQPEAIAERDSIRRVIVEAIVELPEKEQQVLVLYYYEDLTLKEIGKVLEVTESRVSQLHTKAISRLRSKLTHTTQGIT